MDITTIIELIKILADLIRAIIAGADDAQEIKGQCEQRFLEAIDALRQLDEDQARRQQELDNALENRENRDLDSRISSNNA